MSPNRDLIVTGGDDQKVRLFKYPVTFPKQKNKAFTGHSSHVTKVRFSKNQKNLLSIGGNDRTVILWNV
jgi:WD40 repeat protein